LSNKWSVAYVIELMMLKLLAKSIVCYAKTEGEFLVLLVNYFVS